MRSRIFPQKNRLLQRILNLPPQHAPCCLFNLIDDRRR